MSGVRVGVAEEVGESDGGKWIVIIEARFIELDHDQVGERLTIMSCDSDVDGKWRARDAHDRILNILPLANRSKETPSSR